MTRFKVLPPALVSALVEIGRHLAACDRIGDELQCALELMANLSPADIARADLAIADAASLSRYRIRPSRVGLWLSLSTAVSDTEELLRTDDLKNLFIFHRDGRLREAALRRISDGLPNAFQFAALAWRLNDWVPEVRAAAVECATRSFPKTDPSIIAEAATTLLVRQPRWGRWKGERRVLDEAFSRDDVLKHLARLLTHGRNGPLSATLRYSLQASAMDLHLDDIATSAVQPSIRAVALEALINGRASWPNGHSWEWIDKPMGRRRRVSVSGYRDLSIALPRDSLIARGVADRSPIVRRVALDGVMRHLLPVGGGMTFAALLKSDRSPSVRERAEFILRKL